MKLNVRLVQDKLIKLLGGCTKKEKADELYLLHKEIHELKKDIERYKSQIRGLASVSTKFNPESSIYTMTLPNGRIIEIQQSELIHV